MNRNARVLLLFLCALLGALGCSECLEFEQYCDGNSVRTCTWISQKRSYEWIDVPCRDNNYCVEKKSENTDGKDRAFCAFDPEPDPDCVEVQYDRICQGALLVLCEAGYRVSVSDCESSELCVPEFQFCRHSSTCTKQYEETCIDGKAVRCEANYYTNETYTVVFDNCVDAFCMEYQLQLENYESTEAACILSKTPDPECQERFADFDGINFTSRFCEGDSLVTCFGDYRSEVVDCGPDNCLRSYDGNAWCRTPSIV